jgi:hypothetical protein
MHTYLLGCSGSGASAAAIALIRHLVAPSLALSLQLLAPGLGNQGARPLSQASLQPNAHLCEVEGCRFTPIVAVAVHVQHLHVMGQRSEPFAWPL